MSTIKFKLWDKENKIMMQPETPCFVIYPDGEVTEVKHHHDEDWNLLEMEIGGTRDSEGKFITLLHCGGLHDKHGEELYEGDLIISGTGGEDVFAIKRCNDGFCFIGVSGAEKGTQYNMRAFTEEYMVKVGNIFENEDYNSIRTELGLI